MEVLVAVVDDLWLFLRESLFGRVQMRPPVAASVTQSTPSVVDTFVKELSGTALLESPKGLLQSPALLNTGDYYYVGAPNVQLYADPVVAFDNGTYEIVYATQVQLLQVQGRWAQVRLHEEVGWVLKDVLYSSVSDVLPQFDEDVVYDAQHPETVKLRTYIEDIFGAGASGFPLTAEEYVQYRLVRQNRFISWGEERSRLAGTWQRKLKGKQGIYIRITPKTDAIMEYVSDDEGYLSYVEAVHPDNTLKISEIVTAANGPQFQSKKMSSDEWRELRPVFITVA